MPSAPDVNSLLEDGVAALKRGDKTRAQQLLVALLKSEPRHEQAWLWLSGAFDDPNERRRCLTKTLEINPANEIARRALQRLEEQNGRAATPAAESGRAASPLPNPQPFTQASKPGLELPPPPAPLTAPPAALAPTATCPWCGAPVSELDVTCPACQRLVEFDCPECCQAVSLLSAQCPNCQYSMGDFHDRQAYLKNLGEAYLRKGIPAKALPVYRYLEELASDDALVHVALSQVYDELGQTNESVAEAQKAIQINPASPSMLARLGHWYVKSDQPEKLAELIKHIGSVKKDSRRLTLLLGDLEFERRQYPAAYRAYKEVLDARGLKPPELARIHYRMGEMYLAADEIGRALRSFQSAMATGADVQELAEAKARIDQIRPPLPPRALNSYGETFRAMAGPVLLVWLTGLVHIGFRFKHLTLLGGLGLAASPVGAYLVASALSTPLALEWREVLGKKGLTTPTPRAIVGGIGGLILVVSFGLVLFGM